MSSLLYYQERVAELNAQLRKQRLKTKEVSRALASARSRNKKWREENAFMTSKIKSLVKQVHKLEFKLAVLEG